MKRVIEGKTYNTEKATLIGQYVYLNPDDFNFFYAGLYSTPRSKRYFLAGCGGSMSIFRKHCADGSLTSGEKIIPLTDEDAREWRKKYTPVENVSKYFALDNT